MDSPVFSMSTYLGTKADHHKLCIAVILSGPLSASVQSAEHRYNTEGREKGKIYIKVMREERAHGGDGDRTKWNRTGCGKWSRVGGELKEKRSGWEKVERRE